MAKWLITEKNSNQRHCKSLKGQGLAQLIVLASYLSDFTHKITECSKQELTSYTCNITYPKFPCRICIKMSLTKIKLFSMTSVNFGFILNVTILIF